eukprot:2165666-Prymnesium_polylepis.1
MKERGQQQREAACTELRALHWFRLRITDTVIKRYACGFTGYSCTLNTENKRGRARAESPEREGRGALEASERRHSHRGRAEDASLTS